MNVKWKDSGDPDRLRELMVAQTQAKQRDRYRAVLLAGEGFMGQEIDREHLAEVIGRSRQFVDAWVGQYRRHGLAGLYPKKQPGAASKLTPQQMSQFIQWLEKGPTPEEKLAAYNGPILREKLHECFGKLYSLSGVYALLHRMGYNDLMPRTTHPDTDPAALESFKKKISPRRWRKSGPSMRENAS